MLIAAFGVPGPMSAWGFAVLRAMASHVHPACKCIDADGLDLFLEQCGNEDAPVVLTSQFPETDLVQHVLNAFGRAVIFLDDVTQSALYLAAHLNKHDIEIVRAVSASAACVVPLHGQPGVMTVHAADAASLPMESLATQLALHFGFPLADVEMMNLPLPDRFPSAETDTDPHNSRSALASSLLGPFDAFFKSSQPFDMAWPQSVFLSGDRPGHPAPDSVDLTGRARCLIYGPYLHLPPGRWQVDVTIGLDGHIGAQSFVVEMVGGGTRQAVRIVPTTSGLFSATFSMVVSEPQIALELRLIMETGALEGAVSAFDVVMKLASDTLAARNR